MRFEFDSEADALYIRINEGRVERTIELEEGVYADLDAAGNNFQPDWSADGKKIAFTSSSGNSEVYWMDSDGSGETNLTNNAAADLEPAFYPDHHKIAFVSNRDGGDFDIFKMTVNDAGTITDGPTKMTTSTAPDYAPAVSPNGKKIAFVSERGGNSDIYVMKANAPESSTNKPRNLTKNSAEDIQPAFSPDGRKIAFRSNRSGNLDIFKMKADGSGQVNLTNSVEDERRPSWQPDP